MKKKSLLCITISVLIILLSLPTYPVAAKETDRSEAGTQVDADQSFALPTDIVSISAGYYMSSAVRADGSVWTWGGESVQFNGIAYGSYVDAPTMITSANTKSAKCGQFYNDYISHYSSPDSHYLTTALLKDDDSLWLFGGNQFGAIGNGEENSSYRELPYKVLENVVDYDVAGCRSAAVTKDGKLYMWGYNRFGQIGNNSTETVYEPVEVLTDVVSVSLGGGNESYYNGNGHSAAIKSDGSLWMWGCNRFGQLGDGTTVDSHVPKKIMDDVAEVSLGEAFTVVLKKDGTVWTCGKNDSGQLAKGTIQGYSYDMETHYSYGGNYIDDMWPTDVPDADKVLKKVVDLEDMEVKTIEAGYNFAAAVTQSGELYMWGYNNGQNWGISNFSILGNGNTITQPEPIVVLRGVKTVSLGYDHVLALKSDGTLWAWGDNYYGQVGDQSAKSFSRPTEITLGKLNADFHGEGCGNKTVDVMWDDNYLNRDATIYNKDLGYDGIVLSEAASGSGNKNVFSQFGFKIILDGMNNDSIDQPGYLIGCKIMYDYDNPRIEYLMSIRGTKSLLSVDGLTDLKSVRDGFGGAASFCLDSLQSARTQIASELSRMGLSSYKKNTKYYIVGHSLGGACAAKVALRMKNDGVAYANNLYVYTYGAPNYTNFDESLDSSEDMMNIFNFVHDTDIVPMIPEVMYRDKYYKFPLYKAGTTYQVTNKDDPSHYYKVIRDLYGEIPLNFEYSIKQQHITPTYLALVDTFNNRLTELQIKAIKDLSKELYRILSVHCPVDIEVYDANKELYAYTKGESVTYPNLSAVRIEVVGDEKYIELPDESYTVRYIGTDSGTMRIEDQMINAASGDLTYEKSFDNVALENGKQFLSSISEGDNTENTDLYVIDDEGDKTYSVDDNGSETKLALYDIDPDNVHIEVKTQQYDGTPKTAEITVDGLAENEDYRIIYSNNIEVGTATVTVKGINKYAGRVSESFEIYDEGECGSNATWKINPDGVITICGSGSIYDYTADEENAVPWYKHSESIRVVVIEKGITAIGEYAFDECDNLSKVRFTGSKDEWDSIDIGDNNSALMNANIEYNYNPSLPAGNERLLGDADKNGVVNVFDASYVQKGLTGTSGYPEYSKLDKSDIEYRVADVDGSGAVNIFDAAMIQKYLTGTASAQSYGIGDPID